MHLKLAIIQRSTKISCLTHWQTRHKSAWDIPETFFMADAGNGKIRLRCERRVRGQAKWILQHRSSSEDIHKRHRRQVSWYCCVKMEWFERVNVKWPERAALQWAALQWAALQVFQPSYNKEGGSIINHFFQGWSLLLCLTWNSLLEDILGPFHSKQHNAFLQRVFTFMKRAHAQISLCTLAVYKKFFAIQTANIWSVCG